MVVKPRDLVQKGKSVSRNLVFNPNMLHTSVSFLHSADSDQMAQNMQSDHRFTLSDALRCARGGENFELAIFVLLLLAENIHTSL